MFSFICIVSIIASVNAQYSNVNCKSAYCSSCSSSDKSKCTGCISNYMLIDGKCVFEGTKNCISYRTINGTSICTKCNYGY